jgi:hypothetical protein
VTLALLAGLRPTPAGGKPASADGTDDSAISPIGCGPDEPPGTAFTITVTGYTPDRTPVDGPSASSRLHRDAVMACSPFHPSKAASDSARSTRARTPGEMLFGRCGRRIVASASGRQRTTVRAWIGGRSGRATPHNPREER